MGRPSSVGYLHDDDTVSLKYNYCEGEYTWSEGEDI